MVVQTDIFKCQKEFSSLQEHVFFGLGLLTTYLKVEQLILFSRAAGFYSLRSSKFVGWSKVVADSAEAPPPFPRSFSSSLSWGEVSSKRHNWTLTPLPSVSCKSFSLQTQGDGGGVGDTSTIQPCFRFSLTLSHTISTYDTQLLHCNNEEVKQIVLYPNE